MRFYPKSNSPIILGQHFIPFHPLLKAGESARIRHGIPNSPWEKGSLVKTGVLKNQGNSGITVRRKKADTFRQDFNQHKKTTAKNLMDIQTQMAETAGLKTREPFDTLFPVKADTLQAIRQDMEKNDFDPVFPIVVWAEEMVVVDGHTRFSAALDLGLEQVPVVMKSFENQDDAILYSFHIQRNRRNMADEDILKCLVLLDDIHTPSEEEQASPKKNRKAVNQDRAKELGISPAKVDKARKVLEHGDDGIKESVKSGKKTINQAFNEIQENRRESGEIRGRETTGLGNATKYTQALGRFLKELTKIREQGWEDVSREKALADIESIRELIEG